MDELVREAEKIIPWDYAEAIEKFPWIRCSPVQWDERDPWQNLVWMIENLDQMYQSAASVCIRLGSKFALAETTRERKKIEGYNECFLVLWKMGEGKLKLRDIFSQQSPDYRRYIYEEQVEQAAFDFTGG